MQFNNLDFVRADTSHFVSLISRLLTHFIADNHFGLLAFKSFHCVSSQRDTSNLDWLAIERGLCFTL